MPIDAGLNTMLDSLLTQFAAIELIDWLAMFAGIIGVYLSIKERLSAWPALIFCYSAYIYISLRSGYYALGTMNSIFVVLVTVQLILTLRYRGK